MLLLRANTPLLPTLLITLRPLLSRPVAVVAALLLPSAETLLAEMRARPFAALAMEGAAVPVAGAPGDP